MRNLYSLLALPLTLAAMSVCVQAKQPFSAIDVFKIAYAANSVVSPNGQVIAFDRVYMDIMTDTRRHDLWLIGTDGSGLQQVSHGFDVTGPATFTHLGDAVAFSAVKDEKSHIYQDHMLMQPLLAH